jgi:hypothetical protein
MGRMPRRPGAIMKLLREPGQPLTHPPRQDFQPQIDVVDFDRITVWVGKWEQSGHLKHGAAMRSWLKVEDPWVEIQP